MKRHIAFLWLLLLVGVGQVWAEETLRVRPKEKTKERPQTPVTQRNAFEEEEDRSLRYSRYHATAAHFQLFSPLLEEKFPEKRFRAWGNYFSASFYLGSLNDRLAYHLEVGAGASLIRLSLSQPSVDFSHIYLVFPVRGRLIYEVNQKFFAEFFLGTFLRPWEYDSRAAPDGGFHKSTEIFSLDVGIGGGYFLNDNLFARMSFGYQCLAMGLGILL